MTEVMRGRAVDTQEAAGDGGARPARRSRNELREMLLEAGRDVLLAEGLGSGVEHLSFKRVFAHVEDTRGVRITNASVIGRIWDNQEDFQLDVVNSVTLSQGDEGASATRDAMADVLDRIDVSTPAIRRASLAELVQVACARYLAAASTRDGTIQMALVTYVAASGSVASDSPLVERYRQTSDLLTGRYEELYSIGLEACGWRLRPRYEMHEVVALISAVAEGILLHRIVDPDAFRPVVLVSGLDGTEVEWTQHAVTMNALIDVYAEPIPDWRP